MNISRITSYAQTFKGRLILTGYTGKTNIQQSEELMPRNGCGSVKVNPDEVYTEIDTDKTNMTVTTNSVSLPIIGSSDNYPTGTVPVYFREDGKSDLMRMIAIQASIAAGKGNPNHTTIINFQEYDMENMEDTGGE